MMKFTSLKMLKIPAMAICMLAAGICYSCNAHSAVSTEGDAVIALEENAKTGGDGEGLQAPGYDSGTEGGQPSAEDMDIEGGDGAGGSDICGPADGLGAAVEPGSLDLQGGLKEADSLGASADNEAWLYVHVCGEVASPGVYKLPKGSRIYEAIEAAGGILESGVRDFLNLAGEIEDGMKIQVPNQAQAELWQADAPAQAGGVAAGRLDNQKQKVNINTASKEELMSLRGIGESRAEDIINYRDRFGGFKSIEDIMNVSGIKNAAFDKIKDSITV